MSEEKVVTFPRERHILRGSFIGMLPEGAGHIRMMALDGTIVLVTEHFGPYIIRNGVLEKLEMTPIEAHPDGGSDA